VNSTGTFQHGIDGNATLDITGGGALETFGGMRVALEDTSTGDVTVTGNGSRLELGLDLSLGNLGGTGTGAATIGPGAQATVGGTMVIRNANSLLTIDGGSLSTTTLDNSNGGTFNFNSGTVTVDGGAFDPGAGNFFLNGTSTATLNLQGSASSTTGGLIVGTTGAAVLNVADGHSLTAATATIGSMGRVRLDGGTLSVTSLDNTAGGSFNFQSGTLRLVGGTLDNGAILTLPNGGTLTGSGTVSSAIHGQSGSTITVSGDFTLGDDASLLGFVHEGTLNVGNDVVTLRSRGFAQLGVLTTVNGGDLFASSGMALGLGGNLIGFGTVEGRLAAGFGSIITASGGKLTLGDAGSPIGFSSDGVLNISGNTVTIDDSTLADLGTLTTITAGGTLNVPNGAVIEFADNLTGEGLVSSPNDSTKPIINIGDITGNALAEPIMIAGYMKGVGTCDNCNITGTDAPGFGTAAVNRGTVNYNGTLEIEIAGTPDFDQFNHILGEGVASLGGTLDVQLVDGFNPTLGNSFEIITSVGGINGTFSNEIFPPLDPGLSWNVNYDTAGGTVFLEILSKIIDGDYDDTGDVALGDLNLVLFNWNVDGEVLTSNWINQRPAAGIAVGLTELNGVLFNWGNTASAATVPEPAAAVLAVLALLALGIRNPSR